MTKLKSSEYKNYSRFLSNLGKKLTKFYYSKLNKPFKVSNKLNIINSKTGKFEYKGFSKVSIMTINAIKDIIETTK